MDYTIYQIIWLFFIYAFLGWCVEVCFVTVCKGTVVNRGFLNGPVCPIYGVGMVGVLLLLEPVKDNLFWLFLLGMLLCSLVELATGWILEKIFHTRWWDYSDQPFQLGGYICLKFSLMWGLAVTFAVRLIHPMIMGLVSWIPTLLGWILLGLFGAVFAADLIVTLVTILGIRKQLDELQQVADAIHGLSDSISQNLGTKALTADARLDEAKENLERKSAESKEKREQKTAETREKLEEAREALEQKHAENRQLLEQKVTESLQELHQKQQALRESLFTAPRFRTRRLSNAFPALKDALSRRHEKK